MRVLSWATEVGEDDKHCHLYKSSHFVPLWTLWKKLLHQSMKSSENVVVVFVNSWHVKLLFGENLLQLVLQERLFKMFNFQKWLKPSNFSEQGYIIQYHVHRWKEGGNFCQLNNIVLMYHQTLWTITTKKCMVKQYGELLF